MQSTQISRSWTFTHQLPGEAEPRTWLLEDPQVDGMELAYMRHLEAQQKAGIERNYKTSEPGYRVAMEVFQAGFSNGSYKWGGPKFSDTFRDEENLKTIALLWMREAEAKAGVKPKPAGPGLMTMAMLNSMWKQPTGKTNTVQLSDGTEVEFPELVKNKLDTLIAEMLADPLASSPQTAGDLTTPSSEPSSQTEPAGANAK